MIIILKKISSKTRQEDIADILLPAVYGGWLAKRGQIERTLILAQRNIRTRLVQHHVLVEILPDFVAERVIKQLNGKRISGKYIVRNWHNDPRVNHSYALVCKRNNNRRACDRRNEYEEIISEFNANKYDKA